MCVMIFCAVRDLLPSVHGLLPQPATKVGHLGVAAGPFRLEPTLVHSGPKKVGCRGTGLHSGHKRIRWMKAYGAVRAVDRIVRLAEVDLASLSASRLTLCWD